MVHTQDSSVGVVVNNIDTANYGALRGYVVMAASRGGPVLERQVSVMAGAGTFAPWSCGGSEYYDVT